MRAVITAGGPIDGAFADLAGTSVKALAPVRGRTMLDRAIDAVRDCGIDAIAVVGNQEVREASRARVSKVIDSASTGARNVMLALGAWPDDAPLLYVTSDMPYVDGAALRDFIDRTPDGMLAMPLTEYGAFEGRFPSAPPFGITLDGERVVNGGAFVLPAGCSAQIAGVAAQFFDARKAPWRMASLVGLPFLLRFAFRRLSVARLETHAQRVLGIQAIGVRGCAPELGYDADVVEEYRYACEHA